MLHMMFWRFLPPYVTDPKKFRLDTINARGESLMDSNVWREAFLHSRCLVPIDSFIEWVRPVSRSDDCPAWSHDRTCRPIGSTPGGQAAW